MSMITQMKKNEIKNLLLHHIKTLLKKFQSIKIK